MGDWRATVTDYDWEYVEHVQAGRRGWRRRSCDRRNAVDALPLAAGAGADGEHDGILDDRDFESAGFIEMDRI